MSAVEPALLLVGDSFLLARSVEALLKEIQKQIPGQLHRQTFHLSEHSLEAVLAQARSLPFLAQGQVFHLKDAERLKKPQLELLAAYLEHPPAATWLVLECTSLGRDLSLKKFFQGRGALRVMEEPQKRAAGASFIREKLKALGKDIAPRAAAKLQEQMGEFPMFLDTLLDQLATFAGESATVTEAMVEAFEEHWQSVDVFQLAQAISNQETGRALCVLRAVLEENGNDLVSVIGLLHWQMRRFWLAKALIEEGQPEPAVLKKCKISPRQAPYFKSQLRRMSSAGLEKAIEGLFKLDGMLKTGQAGGAALEGWLVQATT